MSTLEVSRLRIPQMEGLDPNVDIATFNLELRNKAGVDVADAITDAQLSRTIEGASSLTVIVDDDGRKIARSGKQGRKVDVELDGLFYTLVGITKGPQSRQLQLKFEDREINTLRYYTKFIHAKRDSVTRAQFILRMIQEVTEIHIPWVIPELDVQQPVSDLQPGQILVDANGRPLVNAQDPTTTPSAPPSSISLVYDLTVKGVQATPEQRQNAAIILQTGVRMGANRTVLVSAIMTAITESSMINLTGGDLDSVGVFQQRASQGWPASRNVATDAAAYFSAAIAENQRNPNEPLQMLCQNVQHSKFADGSNYAPYQGEAEDFVNAYGIQGSAPSGSDVTSTAIATGTGVYEFTRGTLSQQNGQYILTKENSWQAIQRLAQEVNWRAFFVSGTFYYLTDAWLLKSAPIMTINEDSPGIDWIDYDYDEGKKVATVTITAHLSRWSAPPGSIVSIKGQGDIVDGRYILHQIDRSLFDTVATITLKKREPVLPEPTGTSQTALPGDSSSGTPGTGGARAGGTDTPQNSIAAKVVAYAKSQLGVPYAWGAEEQGTAFDCSGLTQAAYAAAGVSIPRVAQNQYDFGPQLPIVSLLEPGDLVFFSDTDSVGNITHVGIYIGNNTIIHAPHTGAVVTTDTTWQGWTAPKYVGATRPWQT